MDRALVIGDELVEYIAERAAELIAERHVDEASCDWLRGADKIAAYIDAPRSRVYGLVSAKRIPIHHDGSALIARRSELDAWLLSGGGRRSRLGLLPSLHELLSHPLMASLQTRQRI